MGKAAKPVQGFGHPQLNSTLPGSVSAPHRAAVAAAVSLHSPAAHAAGVFALVALVAVATGALHLLPSAFLAFLLVGLPWRIYSFTCKRWAFFLVDFCYFGNLAAAAFLIWDACRPLAGLTALVPPSAPHQHVGTSTEPSSLPAERMCTSAAPAEGCSSITAGTDHSQFDLTAQSSTQLRIGLQAAVYVLSEGPLAAALLAWQCAWVFDSPDHIISVLIHLLPGLAMWAHRWVPGASAHPLTLFKSSQLSYQHPDAANPLPGLQLPELSHQHPYGYFGKGAARAATSTSQPLVWLCAAPLAFYLAWQLVYFLVVQVVFRPYIRQHRLDTSYNCLARRAARAKDGRLNRLVRSGSIARRITMYGLLQLAFTIMTGAFAALTYYSYWLGLAWQVVKLLYPLYLGSQHSCKRAVKRSVEVALGALAAQLEADCLKSEATLGQTQVDSLGTGGSGPWAAGAAVPATISSAEVGLSQQSPSRPATRGAARRSTQVGQGLGSLPAQLEVASKAPLKQQHQQHSRPLMAGGGIESELLQLEEQQLQRAALVSWARQLAGEVAKKE